MKTLRPHRRREVGNNSSVNQWAGAIPHSCAFPAHLRARQDFFALFFFNCYKFKRNVQLAPNQRSKVELPLCGSYCENIRVCVNRSLASANLFTQL